MRLFRLFVLLALTLAVVASAPAAPRFRVSGRSLVTVYLDAGRDQGLKVGDRVRVVEGQTRVAEMTIVAVNEHSAACRVDSLKRPIVRGDTVVPAPTPQSARAAAGQAESAKAAVAPKPRVASATGAHPPAPKAAASNDTASASAPGFASLRRQAAPSGPPAVSVPVKASVAPTRAVAPAEVSGPGFKVRYRSAANAYLDAGRARGLNVGDRLRVVAGTTTVAELEVVYVAELSASCKVLSETRPIHAGDVARLVAGAARARGTNDGDAEEAPSATAAVASTRAESFAAPESRIAAAPPGGPWARMRGAASFGYYRSWDNTESALDYQQRTARLDLGLYDIAGQPLSFSVRARSAARTCERGRSA